MRSFALVVSLAAVFAARASFAEQPSQGFAPACSNTTCPHPVADAQIQALHQVGPRLFAPTNHPSGNKPRPIRTNDADVRMASNVVDCTVSKRGIQLNDVIVVLNDECIASPAEATKVACESCRAESDSPATMAANITEVLPNGDLAIKGCQESLHAGEICQRSLTGKISPQSLTPERRVHQRDIAELRIVACKFKRDVDSAVQPASAQVDAQDEVNGLTATKTKRLREKEAQLASLQQEVNQLRSEAGLTQQILIKIQMLEVSLTKMREMGFEFSVVPGRTYDANNLSDLQKMIGDSPVTFYKAPAKVSEGMVDWLCENNLAKVLTRPTIVTVSGRPAELCVGGEARIPGRGGSPAAADFQRFGTEVSLLPIVLGEGRVRLNIRTRVSELDESRKLKIGESVVPAFNVRELDTAIESKFNQSTVLCGGIEKRTESRAIRNKDGTSKVVDENNEVALVVIVTPEAVDLLGSAHDREAIKK